MTALRTTMNYWKWDLEHASLNRRSEVTIIIHANKMATYYLQARRYSIR